VALLFATDAVWGADARSESWLQWSSVPGPDVCLIPEVFASKVERSLGRSPADAAHDATVSVTVRIERVGGASPEPQPRWRGEIQVHGRDGGAHGSRSLSRVGPSCEPLVDALALATALVLSSDATVHAPGRAPGAGKTGAEWTAGPNSEATSAPATAPPPLRYAPQPSWSTAGPVENARVEAPLRSTPPSAWQMGADGGLALGMGLLPEPSPGVEASVFLVLAGGTKIFAAGSAWYPQVSSVGAGHGATLSLASLGLGLCPFYGGPRAWTWRTCARGDVGRLQARGFGFTVSSAQDRLTVDVAATLEIQRQLVGPLYAGVATELVVPLIRDRIAYSGSSGEVVPVFRRSPVAGAGSFRLGCVF